jgi:membrane protein implicated in regulation of membrane protease activity
MQLSIELLKIQIFSEHIHTRFTTIITASYAIVVGFSVLFFTLFYGNLLQLVGFAVAMIVLLMGASYQVYRVRRNYMKTLREISQMVEAVKEGKELPKLDEMLKGWKTTVG